MAENYQNLLIALDGSVESVRAFERGVALAKSHQAKLFLANIIDLRAFQSIATYDEIVAEETKQGAQRLVSDFVQEALEAGLEVEAIVDFGSPKTMIAQTLPKQYNIDLVLMGATGLGYLERLLIGSVAEYVSTHAKCDVLIVR